MNPQSSAQHRNSGITRLEVMIVLVVSGSLALLLLLPVLNAGRFKSKRINCVCHLKQIGMSTRQWAMDHGDQYPGRTSITNGGTLGHALFSESWIHLRALSNELNTPVVLVCPTDRQMNPAKTFGGGFGRNNVSYFVGVDAQEEEPQMILAGDRNLTTNGIRIVPGLYLLSTNHLLGWDDSMHRGCGNIGLADGSVQQFTGNSLRQALAADTNQNRFAIP